MHNLQAYLSSLSLVAAGTVLTVICLFLDRITLKIYGLISMKLGERVEYVPREEWIKFGIIRARVAVTSHHAAAHW